MMSRTTKNCPLDSGHKLLEKILLERRFENCFHFVNLNTNQMFLFLFFTFSQACQYPIGMSCQLENISSYYYISGTTYANSNLTVSIPTLDSCDCVQMNNFSFKFYSIVGSFNFSLYTEPVFTCNNRCNGERDLLHSGNCTNSIPIVFKSDKPELVHYYFKFDLKKGILTKSSCVSKSESSRASFMLFWAFLVVLLC